MGLNPSAGAVEPLQAPERLTDKLAGLLMQRIEFYDRHSATALQSLISVELDTIRTFIFK